MASLIAPADREESGQIGAYKVKKTVSITDEQAQEAMDTLNIRGALEKLNSFPRVEKYICDPIHANQNYCLHSFVPSKGAQPDKDGVFGMLKCRGTFQTTDEMDARAEEIIRNVDSYHELYHGYVGKPFPFAVDPRYVEKTVDIDVKKKVVEEVSQSLKEKRAAEKKMIDDVKEQEEVLRESVEEDRVQDPGEQYTELRVKRANLIHTIVETKKRLVEVQTALRKTCKDIKQADRISGKKYKKVFISRYMEARERAGIPESDDSLIKYLGDGLPDGIYD